MLYSQIKTLLHTPVDDAIRHVAFVANSPYLVTCTQSCMYVWNLLTCTVWFSYALSSPLVSSHPTAAEFAITTAVQSGNAADVV